MPKFVGDFGTTWTKLLDMETGEKSVLKTTDVKNLSPELATGHNAKRFSKNSVGELVALAHGGTRIVGGTFSMLDVGSRDMKYIRLERGDLKSMDWNSQCGALTGFTVQLLGEHFGVDFSDVEPADKALPVTCGVLGMEKVFDEIAGSVAPSDALAMFVKGLAMNAYRFIGSPDKFCLSGGMCDNPLFLASFPKDVEVVPVGRFVLVEGLEYELAEKAKNKANKMASHVEGRC